MAHAYTVRLADGKEYGPADLEALQAWKAEGRIGPDTLVWREGATDWRPLSQVLETGELHAEVALMETVTVAPRPSPAAGMDLPPTTRPEPAAAPPDAPKPNAAVRPRSAPTPRTARRPRPSPWRIVVPLVILAALVAGVRFWWKAGQPARDRQRAEAEIRSFGLADRRFADDLLGLRLEVPEGWIVLRPDSPFFHAPTAKLRLAHPRLGAFARLQAQGGARGTHSLDQVLDRALEDWRLFADGLQEKGRSDTTVGGLPGKKAEVSWSTEGQELRGAVTVWRDGWNEMALLAWGPGSSATALNTATDALVSHLQMAGVAAGKIRAAADAVAPVTPELSRASVEALVEGRLAAGEATEDLPQASIRVVSRGLRALTGQESQEMGLIYAQVYKPLKEKERARLAAWLAQVRVGAAVTPEEGQAMRQALTDGLLTLPEEVRGRLQVLNEKAVTAALAQP
jgi:GYF domain 2